MIISATRTVIIMEMETTKETKRRTVTITFKTTMSMMAIEVPMMITAGTAMAVLAAAAVLAVVLAAAAITTAVETMTVEVLSKMHTSKLR
jgi:hypothetical protein